MALLSAISPIKVQASEPIPVVVEEKINYSAPIECSCVKFARTLVPSLPLGDARDLKPNATLPRIGAIVILNYDGTYHLAVQISKVSTENTYTVDDFNYQPCEETKRIISADDERIIGYWYSDS